MLELSYDVQPDEHGVFDGLQMAEDLISNAAMFLAPYVNGCPACLDNLFSHLANHALEQLHQTKKDSGEMPSMIFAIGEGEQRHAGIRAHLESKHAVVQAILEKESGGVGHAH